ncbi:MAG: hypothetical protein M3O46_03930 [Myxococcota bacterium]|nr:hypothetical protein [Myxococcota bacterium]
MGAQIRILTGQKTYASAENGEASAVGIEPEGIEVWLGATGTDVDRWGGNVEWSGHGLLWSIWMPRHLSGAPAGPGMIEGSSGIHIGAFSVDVDKDISMIGRSGTMLDTSGSGL